MDALIGPLVGLLGYLGQSGAASGALALLAKVAPKLATSSAVGAAIKVVESILPAIPAGIELVKEEIPVIRGVIATLRGKSATTKSQMDQLDEFDARCDGILDRAIAKAEAEDRE